MFPKWLLPLVLILVGSFLFSHWSFNQGFNSQGDLVISSNQTHDALWHIALEQSLKRSLPPQNPIFSGQILKGYHYLADLILVCINFLTGISLLDLYLKISPFILTLLLTTSTLILMTKIFTTKIIAYLTFILALFGSGFAYLAPFFFKQATSNQSVFWLDQPINWLANQQLTLSLILINLILIWYLTSPKKNFILIGLITGLLAGVKIYASVIILPALFVSRHFRILLLATTVTLVIVLAVRTNSSFPFIWQPGWFIKTMYVGENRLSDNDWELRYQTFLAHGNYLHLALIWLEGGLLFLVGNFGVKILGLALIPWALKNTRQKLSLILTTMTLLSITIPLFFLQRGVVWNSIQFMHFAQIPITILLVLGLEKIIGQKKLLITFLIAMILISLPTTYQTILKSSYDTIPHQLISQINKLKTLPPDATVIVDSALNKSSVVAALSARPVYFADSIINDILLIDYSEREKRVLELEITKLGCQPKEYLITANQILSCRAGKLIPLL